MPMFRKLHPEKTGWNLSLINVAVANMEEGAGEGKSSAGRDISHMFRQQEAKLREWQVEDVEDDAVDVKESGTERILVASHVGSEDLTATLTESSQASIIIDDDELHREDLDEFEETVRCVYCGAVMPAFAITAHERFHQAED
jgi:DNA polymerase iota